LRKMLIPAFLLDIARCPLLARFFSPPMLNPSFFTLCAPQAGGDYVHRLSSNLVDNVLDLKQWVSFTPDLIGQQNLGFSLQRSPLIFSLGLFSTSPFSQTPPRSTPRFNLKVFFCFFFFFPFCFFFFFLFFFFFSVSSFCVHPNPQPFCCFLARSSANL